MHLEVLTAHPTMSDQRRALSPSENHTHASSPRPPKQRHPPRLHAVCRRRGRAASLLSLLSGAEHESCSELDGIRRIKPRGLPGGKKMTEMRTSASLAEEPIRIGISACLLGEKVRFDGGHKRDRYLTDTLGQYFQWVRVCPEVEVGLPTPRPSLRLELHDGETRMIMPKESRDLTRQMRTYAKSRAKALEGEDLSGYLLKKDSPNHQKNHRDQLQRAEHITNG